MTPQLRKDVRPPAKGKKKEEGKKIAGRARMVERTLVPVESRYESLLERVSDGFAAFDAAMNYTYINQKGAELLGRKPEDLIGKNYWLEFPEAKGTPFADAYVRALETQKPIVMEDYYAPWDRWFENRIYPSKDGLTIFFTEITERKRAMELLRESEERFRRAMEHAPIPIQIHTEDGEVILVNQAWLRQSGYTREEISTIPEWVDKAYGERRNAIRAEIEQLYSLSEARDEGEDEIRTRNGETRTWHFHTAPLGKLPDGRRLVISMAVDVTERKRVEEALRERERQLSTLIANLPGLVYRSRNDKDWTTEFVSEGVFALTGYPPADFMEHRREFGGLIHPDDQNDVWENIQAALSERRAYELTYRIIAAGGEEKWVWERGSGVYDADGTLLALEGFVTDITERKRAEQLLLAELKILELLSADASLEEVLTAIVEKVEALSVDTIGSILLLDPDGIHVHHGAAPHLPAAYNQALEGAPIGPQEGSCGAAMYLRKQIIVTDIETDPLWVNYRELARSHGLRACWSTPIMDTDGRVLASFAMYYREPRSPEARDFKLIERMTHLARLTLERKRAEQTVLEQLRLITAISDTSPALIYVYDMETQSNVYINKGIEQLLGYSSDEIRGLGDELFPQLIHPQDLPDVIAFQSRIASAADHEILEVEYRIKDRRGAWRTLHSYERPFLRNADGSLKQKIGIALDVTERKRAEEELRLSEERFSHAFHTSPAGITITRIADGKFVDANDAFCRMFEFSREEVIGHTSTELNMWTPEERKKLIEEQVRSGGLENFELRAHAKSGRMVDILFSSKPIELGGEPHHVTTMIDITERKLAQEELRLSRDRLAELSRRLAETRENEARAIGRELHDQIGQMLTAMKITLDLAGQLPAEASAKKIAQAQELTADLLARVSALSLELRPPMLDDLGLLPALLWHVNRYQEQNGIEVEFKHGGIEGKRFAPEIETAAYRCVQESLTNVARHARAARVRLEFRRRGEEMEIQIEDDGVGFDPNAALAKNRGLGGMRERVGLAGGMFEIESEAGKGARMTIRLPWKERT